MVMSTKETSFQTDDKIFHLEKNTIIIIFCENKEKNL